MVKELKTTQQSLEAWPPPQLGTANTTEPPAIFPTSQLTSSPKARFPGVQEVINVSHSSPPKGHFLEIEMDSERIWANL